MTEVTKTAGYPKVLSLGNHTGYLYRLTDVDDAETLTTALGTRIVSYFVSWTGNPGTQTSAGGHSTESSGTITLYPSSDNLGADVLVIVAGA